MKPISWLSLLLIPILVLAGCDAPVSPSIQPTQEVLLPSSTKLPATDTVSPPSSITPTITETLSPTTTETLITTFEPESVKETMQPLLQNPIDCVIPCFLGMTPGKTSLDEIRNFFNSLGLTHKEGTDPNSSRYVYSVAFESNIGRDSSAIFFTSNGLMENIIITPEITKQEGSPREWIAYSPETLIKRFGSPSRVVFAVTWQQKIGVDMIMYFDKSDLVVQYSGIGMDLKPFCPLSAPFYFVRLWIGSNPPNTPSFETVPLETATSLTMDQFTQLMLGDPQYSCFTINGDVFP
jgi:hypothetical protein